MEERQEHDGTPGRNTVPEIAGTSLHSGSVSRLLVAIAGIFAVGLATGAATVYFVLKRPGLDAAHARTLQYEQDLAAARGHLSSAVNAAAALEGRLMVEESTRRGLEASLRKAQEELGRANDTIAFYEQLMPPGPKGAVSVRALDIEPSGPNLRYRVLLMRSSPNDKPFQGALQFVASGLQDGEKAQVELKPATLEADAQHSPVSNGDPEAGTLALEFAEFQRASGLLGLPKGFMPQSVTVNVLEGKTVRVSRRVDLPGSSAAPAKQ